MEKENLTHRVSPVNKPPGLGVASGNKPGLANKLAGPPPGLSGLPQKTEQHLQAKLKQMSELVDSKEQMLSTVLEQNGMLNDQISSLKEELLKSKRESEVLMSSLKRQETALDGVFSRLTVEQEKAEHQQQIAGNQLNKKAIEFVNYKKTVGEQYCNMFGMMQQFMKVASNELDIDIKLPMTSTTTKADHSEFNRVKMELDLKEAETRRLKSENTDISKKLRSMTSCQICDEPFDTRNGSSHLLITRLLNLAKY